MFVNYAHRGASAYAPENTLSSFYLGLQQQANGIETDVQRSKDGVLVLFHDKTMDRVTDCTGSVKDYTWEELSKLLVYGDKEKQFRPDKLVTLEQFLYCFSHLDLTFAIEMKERNLAEEILQKVKKYAVLKKCIFTSFVWEDLEEIRRDCPEARLGYLTEDTSQETAEKILSIGGEQICMKAELLTPELAECYHKEGLAVRAWGVTKPEMISQVIKSGADAGMTVNFPDKLFPYMQL